MRKKSRHNITDEGEYLRVEDALTTHQFLWWRVLNQAIHDAADLTHDNHDKRVEARDAIRWLLGNIKDFNLVCILAGVDPLKFRKTAQRYLLSRFTEIEIGNVFTRTRFQMRTKKAK